MAKHDKHTSDTAASDTTSEVLLPVKGLPVLFHGGEGKDWPGEIKRVGHDSIDVEVTKPNGNKFLPTLPATPGTPSAKGYTWRHV